MQPLERITEKPLSAETLALLPSAGRQGLAAVGLDAAAGPKAVIEAVDQFVFDWQEGKRPPNVEASCDSCWRTVCPSTLPGRSAGVLCGAFSPEKRWQFTQPRWW
jgi:hypothetical protein